MKNLGKAIDSLIQIDASFEEKLKPIKNKWRRWPGKTTKYWAEVLEFLNTGSLIDHPQRDEIRDAVDTKKKKRKRKLYSFETLLTTDKIIGNIPGNIADRIRRQDRLSIEIAKLRVEADMTRSSDLMAEAIRKDYILDIDVKKVWVLLRDHFNLWKRPGNYCLRSKDSVLFLVIQQNEVQFVKPGVVKIDPVLLKKFFRLMGIDIPPELEG